MASKVASPLAAEVASTVADASAEAEPPTPTPPPPFVTMLRVESLGIGEAGAYPVETDVMAPDDLTLPTTLTPVDTSWRGDW